MKVIGEIIKIKDFVIFRDYWNMSDEDLVYLADRKGVLSFLEYGIANHNSFEIHELPHKVRGRIIEDIIKKDQHIKSHIAIVISVVALLVSIIALQA